MKLLHLASNPRYVLLTDSQAKQLFGRPFKSALEHIQLKLINVAKEKIYDSSKSISDIAYELGFKYPQHLTRMFKKNTGLSPNEYHKLN